MMDQSTSSPAPIPAAGGRTSAPAILRDLRATGQPAVLSINGQPGWTVSDPASYAALIALAERAEEEEAIRESIAQMERGEGIPAEDVLAEMRAIIDEAKAKARTKTKRKARA